MTTQELNFSAACRRKSSSNVDEETFFLNAQGNMDKWLHNNLQYSAMWLLPKVCQGGKVISIASGVDTL